MVTKHPTYDPITARFLSPDPFVQNPASSQDYNRYTYVNNNPLRFTDPSGYIHQGWDSHYQMHRDVAVQWANSHGAWNDQFGWNNGYICYEAFGVNQFIGGGGGGGGLSLEDFGLGNTPLSEAEVTLLNTALNGTGIQITEHNGIQGFWVSFGFGSIGKPTVGSDGVWNLSVYNSGMKFVALGNGGGLTNDGNLTNNSNHVIYYKPDNNNDWDAVPLKPGASTSTKVDGVYVNGKVYKVKGGYLSLSINKLNKVVFDYSWYTLAWPRVQFKDKNWLNELLYNSDGGFKYYEWPPGSKNYVRDTQWWNIFNPNNQIQDPRK